MHAGQRMQLVNFWVVAVAFLATAFVQAINSKQTPVAVGVALTGVVVSLTFQQLDVRARQGERVAEKALATYQEQLVAAGADEAIRMVEASHPPERSWRHSYRVLIQGLQAFVAGLFLVSGIYAVLAS